MPLNTANATSKKFKPLRRAAAPVAPLGSAAAAADAACASVILASRAALRASASAASAAAEQSRHFREASGFRACVLVKLARGRLFCLQTLHESGSSLPSAPLLLTLLFWDALVGRWYRGGGGGDDSKNRGKIRSERPFRIHSLKGRCFSSSVAETEPSRLTIARSRSGANTQSGWGEIRRAGGGRDYRR